MSVTLKNFMKSSFRKRGSMRASFLIYGGDKVV